VDSVVQRIERALSFEWLSSRDGLEEQAAERKDVGAMIDLVDFALGLFG
jgi:hypothetical protein